MTHPDLTKHDAEVSLSANGRGPSGGTPPGPPPEAESDKTGPGPLGKRLLRPQTILSFGLALAVLVFLVFRLDIDLAEVRANIREANPLIYAGAVAIYYGTFWLRATRWRWMLAQAGIDEARGYPVPGQRGLIGIFLLSWFANCVVPAKLGDAYRSYLLKRRTGAPFSQTLGTILAERLIDLVVLFSTMVVVAALAFHGRLPQEAMRTLAVGSVLLVGGGVGLLALLFWRHHIERLMPASIREQFGRLHGAVFACLRRPGRFVAISVVIWLADGMRMLLVARALGVDLSFPTAEFVALMSSLLTTLPVTPAGLGVVEAAMIVVLKLVDVEASMAGSIALLDRLITYWSIVAVGLIVYLRALRREVAAPDEPRP